MAKDSVLNIGKGVSVTETATEIVIRIPTGGNYGPSASGKTTIVASTQGNVTLPVSGVTIGVNAYRKN